MKMQFHALSLFLLLSSGVVQAIEPFYEGDDGIRDKVFETNCLFCHSSEKTGSQRNGAPINVNWDTYAATLPNAGRAIVRAVEQMSMPPFSSGLPTLNEEQKAAMLAWKDAGFPRYSTQATFDFSNNELTLPIVQVGGTKYRATLKLVLLENSALGFGFELETAAVTTDNSTSEAVYNLETGEVEMPEIKLLNTTDPNNKVTASMVLIPNQGPLLFEVLSVSFIE